MATRRAALGRDLPEVLLAHLASVGSMTQRSEPSGRRRLERAVGHELADALLDALVSGRGQPRPR